jgi:hypothetical protein
MSKDRCGGAERIAAAIAVGAAVEVVEAAIGALNHELFPRSQ